MAKVEYTKVERNGIPAGVKLTPMMQQYIDAKSSYPDALLFFRMGDFYEMFFQDAELGGQHLGLTVTSRNKDSNVSEPMSGFPHHQLPSYLNKALQAGFKVAVCDQLEDASLARGLVQRGITQIVTPGVVLDTEGLAERSNHFLVAVSASSRPGVELYGLCALDVTSGVFQTTELIGTPALRCELSRLEPKELLVAESNQPLMAELKVRFPHLVFSKLPQEAFDANRSKEVLQPFENEDGESAYDTLLEFGFPSTRLALEATVATIGYVQETQKAFPSSVRVLKAYQVQDSLTLDETAEQNLELFRTVIGGRRKGSLIHLMDLGVTAMGGRKLRRWLKYPLVDPTQINARLDVVDVLKSNLTLREDLRSIFKQTYDLERLNARASLGKANPKEIASIRSTLEQLPYIRALLAGEDTLREVSARINPLETLTSFLQNALTDDPPLALKDGGVIRTGFNEDLDELNQIAMNGKTWLMELESRERANTGINSLKVKYNKVFGYYIEVSKANLHLVPSHYIRKQTLSTAERYFTEELKEFEDKVINAEARRASIEANIFQVVRDEVSVHARELTKAAEALSDLDAFCSLAELAHKYGYCRPIVNDSDILAIKGGRHPVVEQAVGRDRFIPNHVSMDRDTQRLLMITGPNMAGKSTVMRQVALITIMAQMGSFVPAERAEIGVIDRVFTRVGAADDLASGRSTFMVEMSETATILNEATARSLVILDEIGRGTSTFDGVSIAWSVAEHLHDVIGAKTLFATHYHELTELEDLRRLVKNYNIAVSHEGDEMLFLHQLIPGGASRSYGIQVARLAGLPEQVIKRAGEVLEVLEVQQSSGTRNNSQQIEAQGRMPARQMSLFSPPPVQQRPSEVEQALRSADLNQMTPMQALNFLHTLSERLSK